MIGKMPVINQFAWLSIIPQFLLMSLLCFIYYLLGVQEYLLLGAITILIIAFLARNFISIYHRKGIRNLHKQNFDKSIDYFLKSLEFFQKNRWIDKYRFLVLLSSSKYSYKEMALLNIAFCYSQLGDGEKAEYYYNITLNEFPDNNLAKSSLKFIDSVKNKK
jgi:tetratricopeptide (TPR) repeat protein